MSAPAHTVAMDNLTVIANATLIIVHAAAAWGTAGCLLEVERITCSQQGTAASQQLGIQIARKQTAFGTYVSATPTPHLIGAPVSAIVGGTTGAAATCGVNASAEGAGTVTDLHIEGFNNLSGFLWVPVPEERILLGPDQALIVKLRGTPSTLTNWNATLSFVQLA